MLEVIISMIIISLLLLLVQVKTEYSVAQKDNFSQILISPSFSHQANFYCYEERPEINLYLVTVMKKNSPSQNYTYSKYGKFDFNATKPGQKRNILDQKLAISNNGTYFAGAVSDKSIVFIFKYDQSLENYEYLRQISSSRSILRIAFDPKQEDQLLILTRGFIEIKKVDGTLVQSISQTGFIEDSKAIYSPSKYLLATKNDSVIIYTRNQSKFNQFQQITINDEIKDIAISNDENYLTIVHSKIQIQQFFQGQNRFQFYQSIDEDYDLATFGEASEIIILYNDNEMAVFRLVEDQNYKNTQTFINSLFYQVKSNEMNDLIVFSAQANQYSISTLLSCPKLYCKTCPRGSVSCYSCIPHYFLTKQEKCLECQDIDEKCSSCDAPNSCDACLPQHTLFKGKCFNCAIDQCILCIEDKVCSECAQGFNLDNNERCVEDGSSKIGTIIGIISVAIGIIFLGISGALAYKKYKKYKEKKENEKRSSLLQKTEEEQNQNE